MARGNAHCRRAARTLARTALALLVVVGALGGLDSRGVVALQDDEAAAVLDDAVQTMAGVTSFHFNLTTPRGESLFMENLELAGLEGDVQRPDQFRAEVTAKASIIEVTVKVVGIGTTLWVTDPMATEETFVELDLNDAATDDAPPLADLLNPDRLLLAAVDQIEEPSVIGMVDIDGVATTRIDGIVDLSEVQAGTPVPGLQLNTPFPISIWVDADGFVRRLELDGPLTDAESRNVIRRLDLTAYNDPVTIEPPV